MEILVKSGDADTLRRDFHGDRDIIGKNILWEYAETGDIAIEISVEIW